MISTTHIDIHVDKFFPGNIVTQQVNADACASLVSTTNRLIIDETLTAMLTSHPRISVVAENICTSTISAQGTRLIRGKVFLLGELRAPLRK